MITTHEPKLKQSPGRAGPPFTHSLGQAILAMVPYSLVVKTSSGKTKTKTGPCETKTKTGPCETKTKTETSVGETKTETKTRTITLPQT